MDHPPTLCRFEHPGFTTLKRLLFRLTEGDRIPALAIELDGNQAVIPLAAAAKLFGIAPDTPDGRMLNLVGSALRFVAGVRPGDPLPAEVLTGQASWKPSAHHHQLASARLQLLLVDWIGNKDNPITAEMLAAELSYIEALRERLLDRAQLLLHRLVALGRATGQTSVARRETLFQVTRLAATGLAEITTLFDQVDAQTADILTALRTLEQQRSFLRPNRDWLYCTQRAWDPELREWEALSPGERGEQLWKLLDRLYRFLAPRFMPMQEWQKLGTSLVPDHAKATFVW